MFLKTLATLILSLIVSTSFAKDLQCVNNPVTSSLIEKAIFHGPTPKNMKLINLKVCGIYASATIKVLDGSTDDGGVLIKKIKGNWTEITEGAFDIREYGFPKEFW